MTQRDEVPAVLIDLNWFGNKQEITQARAVAESALQTFRVRVWEQEWGMLVVALVMLVSAALLTAFLGDLDNAALVLQVGAPILGIATIRWINRDPKHTTDCKPTAAVNR